MGALMGYIAAIALKVFAWVYLVLAVFFAILLIIGPVSLSQNGIQAQIIPVTLIGVLPPLLTMLSGVFFWALLYCIATITETLIDIRDSRR